MRLGFLLRDRHRGAATNAGEAEASQGFVHTRTGRGGGGDAGVQAFISKQVVLVARIARYGETFGDHQRRGAVEVTIVREAQLKMGD